MENNSKKFKVRFRKIKVTVKKKNQLGQWSRNRGHTTLRGSTTVLKKKKKKGQKRDKKRENCQ